MSTTPTGVAHELTDGDPDINDAAQSFFKNFTQQPDAEEPSEGEEKKQKQPPTDEEPEDKSADESPDDEAKDEEAEGEAETEEQPDAKKYADGDDIYVKIKVNDEELEVPVKDLKRLYGQEAALTKRSQEVAEHRKNTEAEMAKATTALSMMLKRAQERAAPYEKIDFLMAAKELSAEELTGLRQAAQQAFDEKKFFETELNGFMQHVQGEQQKVTREAAQKAIATLKDPASPYHIEDWGDKVYGEIRDFAVKNGLDRKVVDALTDAPVFKLLQQAMLYQKGSQKVVTTKKVDKTPKKIVKSSKTPDPKAGTPDKLKQAASQLRRSGNPEDAAELFMARWADKQGSDE
jgi:hypothetical protein